MGGRKTFLATFGTFVLCGVLYSCRATAVGCEELPETSVPSPNGDWISAATTRGCQAGLLSSTNYSVSVALISRSPSRRTGRTVVFESGDLAEPPTLRWVSERELVVKVNEVGDVWKSRHENAGVKITYLVPNSIWDRLGAVDADQAREERASLELYKAGKLSDKDFRLITESSKAVAKERSTFRQWVVDNATVDRSR